MSLAWKDNKYKDESPLDTVHKIRRILKDIGIMPIEKHWNHSSSSFYSVTVSIPKTTKQFDGLHCAHSTKLLNWRA